MSISYFDGRERNDPALVLAAMLANAVFVLLVVLCWPQLANLLGPAIEWGMSHDASNALDLNAYPYTTLWLLPLIGCIMGWIGLRMGMKLLAAVAACAPLMLIASVTTWFYFTPLAWH